ncbi:MAG TPA: cytochrome d ubiquinol oxidase subunit II [Candidatus Kapabacteria bacterium]|nr:cytochrome d ubiquinol oxidase subunit II [Candidatus Kapabacteria bacterium]
MLPEWIVLIVMIAALLFYALLGGADFGGGMWDLLAMGPRARRQRDAIAEAIGPVWEANHVWLILVIVLLFSAFPSAFGAIMTALHIPLTLVLVGIVMRGAAFVFRKYDAQNDRVHRRWSTLFGIASFLTPLMLGVTVGGLATGAIVVKDGSLTSGFVAGWTTPFALACGLFTQGLFAFLAAVYLTLDTADDPPLQNDFRLRALFSGITLAPAALLVFLLARYEAPALHGATSSWWAAPLFTLTSIAALTALAALFRRRFAAARAAAIAQVALVILGWTLAQYPDLIPGSLSFDAAAAPANVLWILIVCLGIGAVLLIPSLYYLFKVFKASRTQAE